MPFDGFQCHFVSSEYVFVPKVFYESSQVGPEVKSSQTCGPESSLSIPDQTASA